MYLTKGCKTYPVFVLTESGQFSQNRCELYTSLLNEDHISISNINYTFFFKISTEGSLMDYNSNHTDERILTTRLPAICSS